MEHEHVLTTYRNIMRNGDSQVFNRCDICNERIGMFLRHEEYDLERIPVDEDRRMDAPPCRVCGARGVEEHHWAPRALFGNECDLWPIDYLCRPCHIRWHQTMDGVAS